MKKYRWLLVLLIFISCKAQEGERHTPLRIKVLEVEKECVCAPILVIDTSAALIREKNREIHLLRVEIDNLKKKMENIKNLQVIDSILRIKKE